MDREQLLSSLLTADPQPGDFVYVERRGESYAWYRVADGDATPVAETADAWLYYSWQSPLGGDANNARAMLDDLLAEMESMTGSGADRCRWPLDQPYPRGH